MHLAYRDLDIEPLLKLILKGPYGAHLGQCITFDHDLLQMLTAEARASARA
jgi:hypothetical protein